MTELRVVVADDSLVVRHGVARILADAGAEIAGLARDGDELLEIVRAQHPNLAVVDIRMPPGRHGGITSALVIRRDHPATGVLVLSQYLEPAYAFRLLEAGVDGVGYLLKDRLADAPELVAAAERVAEGGSAIDPAVVRELVAARRRDDRVARLTPRERDVLSLLAEGRSNRSIAERLGITAKTVEGMTGIIFEKLELDDDPSDNRRVLAVLAYLDGRRD